MVLNWLGGFVAAAAVSGDHAGTRVTMTMGGETSALPVTEALVASPVDSDRQRQPVGQRNLTAQQMQASWSRRGTL